MNTLHRSLLALLTMAISCCAASAPASEPSIRSLENYHPAESIGELIESSDLIVVGTVGRILQKKQFYGYQENAAYLESIDDEIPVPLGIPSALCRLAF
ncbi:hypothetical protein [Endothiovibrio diazotrophicus]